MNRHRDELDAAVRELRSVRSTDPCAAIALTTIKATIHTLETRWLGPGTSAGDATYDDV